MEARLANSEEISMVDDWEGQRSRGRKKCLFCSPGLWLRNDASRRTCGIPSTLPDNLIFMGHVQEDFNECLRGEELRGHWSANLHTAQRYYLYNINKATLSNIGIELVLHG